MIQFNYWPRLCEEMMLADLLEMEAKMRWNDKPPINCPWERWFAWRPVVLDSGESVWLEWVERRRYYPFSHTRRSAFWVYRDCRPTE